MYQQIPGMPAEPKKKKAPLKKPNLSLRGFHFLHFEMQAGDAGLNLAFTCLTDEIESDAGRR